jgi:hypothetical protein
MAIDDELQRHRETWIGFARLLKWSVVSVAILLGVLAFFLL